MVGIYGLSECSARSSIDIDAPDVGREGVNMLRYARIKLFYFLKGFVAPHARRGRMQDFERLLQPSPGARIIDLGGTPHIWQFVDTPMNITIVNLPGSNMREEISSHHTFTFIEGNATNLPEFKDNHFDVTFSNSVIEHVGGPENEKLFAKEARRLAPSYWVQTPSVWFPLEAHTGIPFWWWIPKPIKSILHRRWEKILPDWNIMVKETVVIKKSNLKSYFPDGILKTETMFGIPKSYYTYRVTQ